MNGQKKKRIIYPTNYRFGFFGHSINKVMLENRIQLRAKAAKLFRRSLVFLKKKCNQQGWKRETDSCIHVASFCERVHMHLPLYPLFDVHFDLLLTNTVHHFFAGRAEQKAAMAL